MIESRQLSVTLGGVTILDAVSVTARSGAVLGVLGPNGSGKTTLLRALGGLANTTSGAAFIDGTDVTKLPRRELARRLALLGQHENIELDYTVFEVALMGRGAHRRWFERHDDIDLERTWLALERVGMDDLAGRRITQLSGGERQRVFLARAIAQDVPNLLLDEPTNHLDIAYQMEALALLRELGVTCVVALHDLNLAAAWCDDVALLDRGRLVAHGAPGTVLTGDTVTSLYRVSADRVTHQRTGAPQLLFDRLQPDEQSIDVRTPLGLATVGPERNQDR